MATTRLMREAEARVPARTAAIPGLQHPNEKMEKGFAKTLAYRVLAGDSVVSRNVAKRGPISGEETRSSSTRSGRRNSKRALAELGLDGKLKRYEHHITHAANAYYGSGFDEALIVSLDGYGSGLAGAASLGRGGKIERLHGIDYPHSLGTFYESVTSGLGFRPAATKARSSAWRRTAIPRCLSDVLLARVDQAARRLSHSREQQLCTSLACWRPSFPRSMSPRPISTFWKSSRTEYVRYHLRSSRSPQRRALRRRGGERQAQSAHLRAGWRRQYLHSPEHG